MPVGAVGVGGVCGAGSGAEAVTGAGEAVRGGVFLAASLHELTER